MVSLFRSYIDAFGLKSRVRVIALRGIPLVSRRWCCCASSTGNRKCSVVSSWLLSYDVSADPYTAGSDCHAYGAVRDAGSQAGSERHVRHHTGGARREATAASCPRVSCRMTRSEKRFAGLESRLRAGSRDADELVGLGWWPMSDWSPLLRGCNAQLCIFRMGLCCVRARGKGHQG